MSEAKPVGDSLCVGIGHAQGGRGKAGGVDHCARADGNARWLPEDRLPPNAVHATEAVRIARNRGNDSGRSDSADQTGSPVRHDEVARSIHRQTLGTIELRRAADSIRNSFDERGERVILKSYFGAPALMVLVRALCAIAVLPFGDLVREVERAGSTLNFVTSLKPGQSAGGGVISVSVDGLLYSFGMPMFAALTLAAREPARWRILAIGIAALLPFVTFGAVADLLKNVAITAGPIVASQSGFSAGQREAIAFAYQFGTLILPTVAPAIVWVLSHRAFLERLRAQGPR